MTTTKENVAFHGLVAEFVNDRDLLMAAREARRFGYTKMEAYSPFPVHGIDDARGDREDRSGDRPGGDGLGHPSAVVDRFGQLSAGDRREAAVLPRIRYAGHV